MIGMKILFYTENEWLFMYFSFFVPSIKNLNRFTVKLFVLEFCSINNCAVFIG